MSDHTPEPWRVHTPRQSVLVMNHEGYVLAEFMQFGDDPRPANARRVCACVNACAGIPNELLEQHPAAISEVYAQSIIATEAENAALRTQVADLRAALTDLCDETDEHGWDDHDGRLSHVTYVTVLCAQKVLRETQPQEVQS